MPGDQVYIEAYDELQTMRLIDGGPIPFDKILWYAVDMLCLDTDVAEIFTSVIREMDVVYQEWLRKERDKAKPKTSSSQGGATGPRSRSRPPRRPPARRR